MKNISYLVISVLFCINASASTGKVTELHSPAKENSSLSRLFTSAQGDVYLSWVESEEGKAQLFYSQLADASWTKEKIIGSGDDWMLHWADFPSVLIDEQRVMAHYSQKSQAGKYSFDVKTVFSHDKGNNFSKAYTLNLEGVKGENGMVSLLPLEGGRSFATWLDSRTTVKEGDTGGMSLRGATFNSTGEIIKQWELDNRTCDCCSTDTAMTKQGPVVVYRDRSDTDIRDISIVRQVNGEWTAPVTIHNDGWQIKGCPMNGPAIDAKDNYVAVSWFTLKNDVPSINLKLSKDGGKTFGDLIEVVNGDINGRVDIEIIESGAVVISWFASNPENTKLMLAKYSFSGKFIDKLVVAESKSLRRSGLPSITSHENQIYMSWTDIDTNKVKVAKITWDSAPSDIL